MRGRAADALAAVVDRLRADAEDSAREVAVRILAEVPEYDRFTRDDAQAEFSGAVRAVVDLFPSLAATGRRLVEDERSTIADVGERRAREGIALSAVTAAANVGFEVARARVFDAFWQLPETLRKPAALEELIASLDAFKFDALASMRDGFDRVEEEDRRDRDRARDAFLTGLLLDEAPDLHAVHAGAAELDVSLTAPLELLVLVDAPTVCSSEHALRMIGRTFQDRASLLARRLEPPVLGPVAVEYGEQSPPLRCVLLPEADPPRWENVAPALTAACNELGVAVVHDRVADVVDLHPTLVRLMAASPVAERAVRHVGAVATPEALSGYRHAAGMSAAEREFELRTAVGPLKAIRQTASRHIETLRVLFDEAFNMSRAAERLAVSAEAVKDRVRRIEELTGLSLGDRNHRRRLDLVLCLLDLYEDTLPPAGDPWWHHDGRRKRGGPPGWGSLIPRSGDEALHMESERSPTSRISQERGVEKHGFWG